MLAVCMSTSLNISLCYSALNMVNAVDLHNGIILSTRDCHIINLHAHL